MASSDEHGADVERTRGQATSTTVVVHVGTDALPNVTVARGTAVLRLTSDVTLTFESARAMRDWLQVAAHQLTRLAIGAGRT